MTAARTGASLTRPPASARQALTASGEARYNPSIYRRCMWPSGQTRSATLQLLGVACDHADEVAALRAHVVLCKDSSRNLRIAGAGLCSGTLAGQVCAVSGGVIWRPMGGQLGDSARQQERQPRRLENVVNPSRRTKLMKPLYPSPRN